MENGEEKEPAKEATKRKAEDGEEATEAAKEGDAPEPVPVSAEKIAKLTEGGEEKAAEEKPAAEEATA